jgi:hypothetical protein
MTPDQVEQAMKAWIADRYRSLDPQLAQPLPLEENE